MRDSIEKSLRKIQPVNGTLFPTKVIAQDAERCDRSMWVVEADDAYKIDCKAVGWVDDLLREYIFKQLSNDGFVVDADTLTILKEENDDISEPIAETDFNLGFQDGDDSGDKGDSGSSRR